MAVHKLTNRNESELIIGKLIIENFLIINVEIISEFTITEGRSTEVMSEKLDIWRKTYY